MCLPCVYSGPIGPPLDFHVFTVLVGGTRAGLPWVYSAGLWVSHGTPMGLHWWSKGHGASIHL